MPRGLIIQIVLGLVGSLFEAVVVGTPNWSGWVVPRQPTLSGQTGRARRAMPYWAKDGQQYINRCTTALLPATSLLAIMLRRASTKIAHNSTIPVLGASQDLKPLQNLIIAEKAVLVS